MKIKMTYEQYRLIRDALIVAHLGSVQYYSDCSATIEKAFEATKMENLK